MASKKIAPEDMQVEDKLKHLYQLQTILSEVDRIRILRGELPLEVEDLEDEIEGLKTRIERAKDDVVAVRANINEFQRKASEAEKLVEKYKEQLDNVRNNREYDSLNKEIEFQTLEMELCNKRIRENMQAQKVKEELIESSEQSLEERRRNLALKQEELEEIIEETKSDEDRLRERAKDLELQIEPRLLTSFKRIRKSSRNGLGIVYVQRDACGGCFSKIPPQKQLDVRMRKKIIVCEYCGRILIDPELAGVKTETAAKEEKPTRRRRSRAKGQSETDTNAK